MSSSLHTAKKVTNYFSNFTNNTQILQYKITLSKTTELCKANFTCSVAVIVLALIKTEN